MNRLEFLSDDESIHFFNKLLKCLFGHAGGEGGEKYFSGMGSPKTVLNPKTGRRVLMTGALGRQIVADRKKKKKPTKKITKSVSKKTLKNNKALVKRVNSAARETVLKVTKTGIVRPSAAADYRSGVPLGTVVCYGGSCKRLKLDRNGRPFYG